MTKRKTIAVFLIAVVLCSVCLLVAGCPDKNEKKKYDVTMKIVCREVVDDRLFGPILGEWIFAPDVPEIHIEREYDGKEYQYYIYKYRIPDHPTLSDTWFSPNSEGPNVFYSSLNVEGHIAGTPAPKSVSERGDYCYIFQASSTSNIWYFRSARLYIDVK